MKKNTLVYTLVKVLRWFVVAALLGVLVNVAAPPHVAHAATLTVNSTADSLANDGQCTLREAITNANNNANTWVDCVPVGGYGNDVITFNAGLPAIVLTIAPDATPDDNQDGDLDILASGGDLTIQGNGASVTIIDGNATDRVFHVCPSTPYCGINVVFNSVTIQNGNTGSNGGGIHNKGTMTVTASTVISNTAAVWGGGIYSDVDGTTTVDASTVISNTASYGGGILTIATLNVQNGSTIGGAGAGNMATIDGGGIYNWAGTTTVDASTVISNTATHGGGIYNASSLNVQNGSTIGRAGAGNTATADGGGIYNSAGTTAVDASTVSANTANDEGGGIYNASSATTTTVTGSRILYNTATNDGGGVYNNCNVAGATSVTGSCIIGNSANSFHNAQAAQQIATGNWWGAATGPNTPCADTTGGNVDTSSFRTTPIMGCPNGCSDLQVNKANDTGGNGTVGVTFNWTLAVSNPGGAKATFNAGQRILVDDLPPGPTYGAPTPGNFTRITNSGNIHCAIAANTLTCDATGGSVTIGVITGRFDVVFSATSIITGVLTNPVAAGNCRVDPDGNVTEGDETNNDCPANSVAVTAPSITVYLPLIFKSFVSASTW